MAALESLVSSGRIVDIALAVLVVEVLVIIGVRRVTGSGVATPSLLINAGAGGSLMLALRAALSGSAWTWVATFLVAALVFHAADVAERWERNRTS